ncbi:putative zinc ribbon domain protein [Novipirellula aureliae]|uniref:Putative zinc ribbon domain protein n=1 Tax=Novipirellula aureliae TaxID=2527966 RepID=A0A5C6E2N1_9BACT|nr:C4-type zinc ribbon domain-containing protein [Novipirellula aureliae]TWU41409.1 putative zinc ribbon domain protein [Novipirellula aureliae]
MLNRTSIEISTELLRTLHRIHRQLTDLRSQLDRGPRQIKAGEAMVVRSAAAIAEIEERRKKAILASDEKQLQLQTRELHIEELKAKLNIAGSNREFSLLKDQIAADEQANLVLSDEIFEGLERIDSIDQELAKAQAEWQEQQADQQQRVADVDAKMKTLTVELHRVEAELEESEKQIPAAVKADYQRMVRAKGEEALAPTDGGSCGGCNQTLTTQLISTVQLSQLVRCPNCNAFLYLPENRRP